MSKRTIEELVVAAARGEPLPLEERVRLDAALAGDATAQAQHRAQQALGAELAELRRVLASLPVPDDERVLAAAFRHGHALRRAHSRRRKRYAALGAVAFAALIAAVLSTPAHWRSRPQGPTPAAAPPESAAVFEALPYAPAMPASGGAYSVVRVRIPVSSLTASFAPDGSEVVEADVLIGEDGLVSAIRFSRAGTVYVSMESEQ